MYNYYEYICFILIYFSLVYCLYFCLISVFCDLLNFIVELECLLGKFGLDCNECCSGYCMNNELCDYISGVCCSGCCDGYIGLGCNNCKMCRCVKNY